MNRPYPSRRTFLQTAAGSLALTPAGKLLAQEGTLAPWRTFEIVTRVELLKPSGASRVWIPGAALGETPYQKTLSNTFECERGEGRTVQQPADALELVGFVVAHP